jgi:hypothetical protein
LAKRRPISNRVLSIIRKGSHRLNINLPDTAHCYRPIRDQVYHWKAISPLLHTN